MSIRTRAAALAIVALSATSLTLTTVQTADASARHFKSCAALNKVYPHGVGLVGAHDHSSSTKVTNFKRSGPLYRANNGPRNVRTGEYDLDRDNDHIACEKL
jgi:hypothetical protein